jgi:hypothetical protein
MKYCPKCIVVKNGIKYCDLCGTELCTNNSSNLSVPYTDPYGTWKVTTEGDEEGKTVTDLGIHIGFLDEIAFKLAPSCYYSLRFQRVACHDYSFSDAKEVNITLASESGSWEWGPEYRVIKIGEMMSRHDRPVEVVSCSYYGSVLIRKL